MFSDKIPQEIIEHHNVKQFVAVLDGVQEYKTDQINSALRIYSPILSTNVKWGLKYLEEFGVTGLSEEIPLKYLQMLSLNISTITSLIGSSLGVEAFCSIFTLGEVTIDSSAMYASPTMLLLDSDTEGYIVDSTDDPRFYLCSSTEDFTKVGIVKIHIKSMAFNNPTSTEAVMMYNFIIKFLQTYIPLSHTELDVTVEGRGEDYFHKLINPYINGEY